MMIGRSMCAAMSFTIASVNAPAWVEVPIRMVGWTCATTSARPIAPPPAAQPLTSSRVRAYGCWKSSSPGVVADQQPAAAQRVEPSGRLLRRQPLPDHLIAHHVRDAQPSGAGTVDDDPLVPDPGSGGAHRGEHGRHDGRRGALHVIVEGADLIGVLVQDPAGVGGAEILPVQHRVREQFADRGDVGVDQVVVPLVADPGVPGTQVHVVVEQLEVVGTHVQDHRQHPPGWIPAAAV